jgi:hypothetical protein
MCGTFRSTVAETKAEAYSRDKPRSRKKGKKGQPRCHKAPKPGNGVLHAAGDVALPANVLKLTAGLMRAAAQLAARVEPSFHQWDAAIHGHAGRRPQGWGSLVAELRALLGEEALSVDEADAALHLLMPPVWLPPGAMRTAAEESGASEEWTSSAATQVAAAGGSDAGEAAVAGGGGNAGSSTAAAAAVAAVAAEGAGDGGAACRRWVGLGGGGGEGEGAMAGREADWAVGWAEGDDGGGELGDGGADWEPGLHSPCRAGRWRRWRWSGEAMAMAVGWAEGGEGGGGQGDGGGDWEPGLLPMPPAAF